MKKLLLFFFCMATLYPCFCQLYTQPYATALENSTEVIAKNKIKCEKIYSQIYSHELTKKNISVFSCIASLEYDSSANLISRIEHVNNTEDTTLLDYQYNKDSSIHRILIHYPYPKPYREIIEYGYDSVGNRELIYTYDEDTTYMTVLKNEYNDNHQLMCSYKGDDKMKLYLQNRWYYSEDGNFSKEEIYNQKGKLNTSIIYEFDKTENKITVFNEYHKGKHLQEEIFLDSAHHYIKRNSRLPIKDLTMGSRFIGPLVGNPMTEEYTYNHDGTLSECIVFLNNKKFMVFQYYYQKY